MVLGGDVQFDVFSGDVRLGNDEARPPVSSYRSRDPNRDAHRPDALDAWTDRLSEVTSPEGEVTSYTFGPGGAVARVDYPFGGTLSRTFGADLRVATETRPFGTTLTFGYDTAGRVTSRTGSDGSSQSFTYGPGDRMATITDGTGTTTYSYDAAGRFSGLDQQSGGAWQQDHDALDRVSAVRARAPLSPATAFESTYTYDAAGNLHTVTDPFGRTTTYTYDAANRLTDIVRPNGVRTTTTYDARDRVASIVHADGAGTVLASVAYVRSASGEPTRIAREDGSYVLIDYDAALRVERERYFDASDVLEEEIAYTYDRDGNRTTRTTSAGTETYVYGPGSQLLRIERGGVPVSEYTYDGGGRVTRLERDGRDWTLDYDADDHVVEIEDASTGEGARYGFDAEGRRVSRQALMAGLVVAGLSMVTAPTLAADLDSPHLTADDSGAARAGYVFDGEHAMARYDASSGEPTYYLRDAMATRHKRSPRGHPRGPWRAELKRSPRGHPRGPSRHKRSPRGHPRGPWRAELRSHEWVLSDGYSSPTEGAVGLPRSRSESNRDDRARSDDAASYRARTSTTTPSSAPPSMSLREWAVATTEVRRTGRRGGPS